MSREKYDIATRLVQTNTDGEKGAVNYPVYQSTSFSYDNAEELARVFNNRANGYIYSRINNPTNNNFEKQMVNLESGLGAVSCASGMAAIATAVLSLVKSGDQIVAGNSLFGGTYNFFKEDLSQLGIRTKFVNATSLRQYQQAINDKTRLVFLETLGNPGLDIPDIKAISKLTAEANIPLVVDNTLLTPYLFRAKKAGANIVIYSTSKYINGSANSLGGIIIDLGNFNWQTARIPVLKKYLEYDSFCYLAKMRQDIFRNLGACSSPFNSFLHSTGLGTLALRMEKHCQNALQLAQFLNKHNKVKKVNYPGLKDNSFHEIASKQFDNKYGGLLTFELKNKKQCYKVINKLKLAHNMANLGDIRTLIIHPQSTIYSNIDQNKQKKLGVTPQLIRVSVGIENIEDIIADFEQALAVLK